MPTLEQLERDVWPEPAPHEATSLITKCHRLRKTPIEEFTVENLRTLIGQGIGVAHLAPVALAVLDHEPLAQGDFYPGDLLSAILQPTNWPALEPWSARLEDVCNAARSALPANPKPYEHNGQAIPSAAIGLLDATAAYINRRSRKH
jgi:hypothetical protein